LLWFYVFIGLSFYESEQCEDKKHPEDTNMEQRYKNTDDDDCSMNTGTFLFLLLSLYWTTNVIINFIRVTVAGVMATWLYSKADARGCCCTVAIWGSLLRGFTYSFGSICFGSLLQGLIAVLRWITSSAKTNRSENNCCGDCCGGLCFCIVDCIANLGGDLFDYFSQWNYIYIALYGSSYIESGKAVIRLFQVRGWRMNQKGFESIITERLTGYVLGWLTFVMGILTGLSALAIERIVTLRNPDPKYDSYVYGPLPHWRWFAFM
jgi:hypothetical protein